MPAADTTEILLLHLPRYLGRVAPTPVAPVRRDHETVRETALGRITANKTLRETALYLLVMLHK